MIVYLAHPIDHAEGNDHGATGAAVALAEAGFTAVYDPAAAWNGSANPIDDAMAVQTINLAAMTRANAVLALLPAGVTTVGTPIEVFQATELGIPAVVVASRSSLVLEWLGVDVVQDTNTAAAMLYELARGNA